MREAVVPDEQGFGPVTVDLTIHRGVWVTGRVTDKTTGQPLPARMMYTTYLENPHTFELPEFHRRSGTGVLDGYQGRYETKPDGTYRVVAAPGKAIIGAWCMIEGYRMGIGFDQIPVFKGNDFPPLYQGMPHRRVTTIVKEVDVPEGTESATCDLPIDKGETLKVTISDSQGNAAKGPFQIRGHVPENYVGWHHQTVTRPYFDATGFTADEERTLYVLDEDHRVGRVVRVKFASIKDHKLNIQLEQLAEVSGRLTTMQGYPLAKASIAANDSVGGRTVRQIATDAEGRFSTALPTGTKYYLYVDRGPYVGREIAKDLEPKPGNKTDLGDVKLERQR